MKTHKVTEGEIKTPKKARPQVYRALEIAMEKRALAIHRPTATKTETNEITNWTVAEADMLEG